MQNNFDTFPFTWVPWEFYFFQLLDRSKSWSNNKARCIKSYCIADREELDKKMAEMIAISDATNARVYCHPWRRSSNQILSQTIHYLTWCVLDKNKQHKAYRARDSMCWKYGAERVRLVDVDSLNYDDVTETIKKVREVWWPFDPRLINKTINWYHILYRSKFDRRKASLKRDIHTSNPTFIYWKQ